MVCYSDVQENFINICRNWDLGAGKAFIKMFPNFQINNGIKIHITPENSLYNIFFKLDCSEEKDMPLICYIKDEMNAEKVFAVISRQ